MKQIFKLTLQRSNAPTRFRQFLLVLLLALSFGIQAVSAQPCNPLADFTFTVSGCDVSFQPYSNGSGITHFWTFQSFDNIGPVVSASNIANPIHTFGLANPGIRTITHTVTITGVIYTCTKTIQVNCTEGCEERAITYVVNGCTVNFFSSLPGGNWFFGDGASSSLTNTTHTYAMSGDYVVTYTDLLGNTCRKTIRVACEQISACCTAAFTAIVKRECSILKLSLNAECTASGTHSWSIVPINSPTNCLTLFNFFQGMPVQGMIQLTNINTCEVTSLLVTHTFTCQNGTVLTSTQTVPILDAGIFIGKNGMNTPLTDYNCVLPGAVYNGPCTVYSSGIVTVDKIFTFSSANVRVEPGLSGFDLIKDFTLNQNTLVSGNAEPECSCLWRGIQVFNTTMTTDSDASIQDALYAIRGGQKSQLFIQKTLFAKNFIGIRATDGLYLLNLLGENRFDGLGPLKEICSLEPLKADIEAPAFGNYGNQPIGPVLYTTERGFAGIYVGRGNLNLNPVGVFSKVNRFLNLAYGIMAYDGDVSINQNSIFENIAGGFYQDRRTAGILYVDRLLAGPNKFEYIGFSPIPDFTNCVQGMQIRSEQAVGPTRIGITHANMNGVRTGIFLDARFGGGEFLGTGATGSFVGVKRNTILANRLAPTLVSNGGITFGDNSPNFSNVDISENTVDLSYPLGGTGGCGGIIANGAGTLSDPGPGGIEVDIHDNRVTLSNDADFGIAGTTRPNGWIRNNSGGNVASGNGIFVTAGNSQAGIHLFGSWNNGLVACNQIEVLSNVSLGLFSGWNSPNVNILRNKVTGPGNGAHFQLDCTDAEFRCNDMINNTVGLLYDNIAFTGDQGTATVTNGNRWFGAFPGGGAVADATVNVTASKYFVRGAANETPPTVFPLSIWFNPAINATVDCILNSCPAPPPPMAIESSYSITGLDSLVAQGLAVLPGTPYSEGVTWQHELRLWNKIKDHPGLEQNNSMLQNYITGLAGSNIEAFWNVQLEMRSKLMPDAIITGNFLSNLNVIQQLEAQIMRLDSSRQVTTDTDTSQITSIQQQLVSEEAILNSLLLEQQGIYSQIESNLTAAISELETQLTSITPTNLCETNLRRVYEIYLQTYASSVGPDSSLLAELEMIALQCPMEGGPGVYIAGALYQGFTGIFPAQELCTDTEERGLEKNLNSNTSLSIYPNPSQGSVVVKIPTGFMGTNNLLSIHNSQGKIVKIVPIDEQFIVTLDLSSLPNGLYFLSILGNYSAAKSETFIIQH
jgi:hypothetical protein